MKIPKKLMRKLEQGEAFERYPRVIMSMDNKRVLYGRSRVKKVYDVVSIPWDNSLSTHKTKREAFVALKKIRKENPTQRFTIKQVWIKK